MTQAQWAAVDHYFHDLYIGEDAALDAALRESDAAGLPQIAVSPMQGKLLMLLVQLLKARSILELGTLGGYSTIWMARGLGDGGRLVTLEAEPRHAQVAQANIDRAGVGGKVELRLGKALDTLPLLQAEGYGPFDLIFIDADKPNNPHYLAWALKLSRPGTLIIVDNVVRDGRVVDETSDDPSVQGTRAVNALLASEPRLTATALQTVGQKGYDGFAMAVVTAD